jgi:plastocyanin
MLRTNVITPLARFFLPLSVASLLGLIGYGVFTGDMLGIVLMLVVVVVAGFTGIVVSGFRVNDVAAPVPAEAPAPQRLEVVRVPLPAGGVWPFAAALSVSLLLLGLVLGPVVAYFGLAVGAIAAVGWLAQVSADMTGRQVDMLPLGIPVLGLCTIASTIFFVSRVLLAVPEQASTFIALMLAVLIMAGSSFLALKPSIPGRTGAWILGVAAVIMVGAGIVAANVGERNIEQHAGHEKVELEAKGIAFDKKELKFHAESDSTLLFVNADKGILHNVAMYEHDAKGPVVFQGDVVAGPGEATYKFKAPALGEYYFQCDIHPNMNGKVVVE